MTCADLPPGMVIVPQYQSNKVQTEEAISNDEEMVLGESVPVNATSRAVNFLKTSDGNFIVKKTTFHISDTVAKKCLWSVARTEVLLEVPCGLMGVPTSALWVVLLGCWSIPAEWLI